MRLPTPEHIKSAVIDAWLKGKTRDNIALKGDQISFGRNQYT
jgi:hypothetical protein